MADINVVAKQPTLSWVWMLLIAMVVAGALWWMFAPQTSAPAETYRAPALASQSLALV